MAPYIEEVWNSVRDEHHERLVAGLKELKQDDFLSDFMIKAGGRHFLVHRVVIATASSYFKGMFASNMKEANERSVVMQDITPQTVEQCITFMYAGEAAIDMENVEDIAFAASLMDLQGMQMLCAKYLEQELSIENCVFIRRIADEYCWNALKTKADECIISYFEILLEREDFITSLRLADLLHYLKLSKVEHGVQWTAILKYLQGIENPDEKEVKQLLQATSFPFSFMIGVVFQSPVVLESHAMKVCVIQQCFTDITDLENEINLDNCFMLLSLSQEFSHPEAEKTVMHFMLRNCDLIVLRNEFKELDFDTVSVLLDPSNTNFSSELTRAKGIFRWLKHKSYRAMWFPELYALIDLEQLPLRYLKSTLPSEPLLSEFPECREHLDAFLRGDTSIEKSSCDVVSDQNKIDEKSVTVGTQGATVLLESFTIQIPADAFARESSVSAVVYRQLWKPGLGLFHCRHRNPKALSNCDPASFFLDFHVFGEMRKPALVSINLTKSKSSEQEVMLLCRTWDNEWKTIGLRDVNNSHVQIFIQHSCCIVAAVQSRASRSRQNMCLNGTDQWYKILATYILRRQLQQQQAEKAIKYKLENLFEEDILAMMKKTAVKSQEIDSAGGSIALFGCKLTFPVGAVEERTQVSLSVDNNPDHYPKQLHCISTIFGFKPSMMFKKPVEVEIDTWFGPEEGESISALLYSRKSADLEWKNFGSVELNRSNKIKFSTFHFCEMTVCVEPQDLSKGEYTVSNSVYIQQGTCMIHSSFYLDSKTEHDVWQVMRRKSLATLSSRELHVVGKETEKIEINASITKPKSKDIANIVPSSMFPIEKVTKFKIYDVQLDPDLDNLDDYQGLVKGNYSVGVQGKEPDTAIISRKWPVLLDPEDKRVNQNNYGNTIATGNSSITQENRDTKFSTHSHITAVKRKFFSS